MSYSFQATALPISETRSKLNDDRVFQATAPEAIAGVLCAMLDTYETNGAKTVNVNVYGHCPQAKEPGTAHIEVVVIE